MGLDAKREMLDAAESDYAVVVGELTRFGTWQKQPVQSVYIVEEGTTPEGTSYFVLDLVSQGTQHAVHCFTSPASFSSTVLALVRI